VEREANKCAGIEILSLLKIGSNPSPCLAFLQGDMLSIHPLSLVSIDHPFLKNNNNHIYPFYLHKKEKPDRRLPNKDFTSSYFKPGHSFF
jgi:hypothetical protein